MPRKHKPNKIIANEDNMEMNTSIKVISNLKELPKGNMIEYNWNEALSPHTAAQKFFINEGYKPTNMYCMIRWFIPISKNIEE